MNLSSNPIVPEHPRDDLRQSMAGGRCGVQTNGIADHDALPKARNASGIEILHRVSGHLWKSRFY